jgi:hypothetical protein
LALLLLLVVVMVLMMAIGCCTCCCCCPVTAAPVAAVPESLLCRAHEGREVQGFLKGNMAGDFAAKDTIKAL